MSNLLEDEWENFLNSDFSNNDHINRNDKIEKIAPKCSDIYISTKTKIAYLNSNINLEEVFWNIPILDYNENKEGVIKKQMKFNILTKDAKEIILEKVNNNYNGLYKEILTLSHVDNGKLFKDVKKISIGICKKDIINQRSKKKSAFYNCFVLILRLRTRDTFKEIHVKVFNTGKLEIPGIQENSLFEKTLEYVKNLIKNITTNNDMLAYKENSIETVLINSNFTCGYYINRDILYDILCNKYGISSSYDPCSYPGIQCKYTNVSDGIKQEISFMIFRTGSILIVGKCNEDILIIIYNKIKEILTEEYANIYQEGYIEQDQKKDKKKKIRKKTIVINS
tara:strand:- start:3706 stop:4719 length:1014 start_codon:yes stop_codon:yes gene_type:complete